MSRPRLRPDTTHNGVPIPLYDIDMGVRRFAVGYDNPIRRCDARVYDGPVPPAPAPTPPPRRRRRSKP